MTDRFRPDYSKAKAEAEQSTKYSELLRIWDEANPYPCCFRDIKSRPCGKMDCNTDLAHTFCPYVKEYHRAQRLWSNYALDRATKPEAKNKSKWMQW